jgi:hypothetical protein
VAAKILDLPLGGKLESLELTLPGEIGKLEMGALHRSEEASAKVREVSVPVPSSSDLAPNRASPNSPQNTLPTRILAIDNLVLLGTPSHDHMALTFAAGVGKNED